jgi:hypothetical protein
MNMERGVVEILVFLTSAFDEANDHLDATWERTEIPTAIPDVVRKAKLAAPRPGSSSSSFITVSSSSSMALQSL